MWSNEQQDGLDEIGRSSESAALFSSQAKLKLKCRLVALIRVRRANCDDEGSSHDGSEGSLSDVCNDVHLIDFLAGLLTYFPDDRLTPAAAFAHPFLSSLCPASLLFRSCHTSCAEAQSDGLREEEVETKLLREAEQVCAGPRPFVGATLREAPRTLRDSRHDPDPARLKTRPTTLEALETLDTARVRHAASGAGRRPLSAGMHEAAAQTGPGAVPEAHPGGAGGGSRGTVRFAPEPRYIAGSSRYFPAGGRKRLHAASAARETLVESSGGGVEDKLMGSGSENARRGAALDGPVALDGAGIAGCSREGSLGGGAGSRQAGRWCLGDGAGTGQAAQVVGHRGALAAAGADAGADAGIASVFRLSAGAERAWRGDEERKCLRLHRDEEEGSGWRVDAGGAALTGARGAARDAPGRPPSSAVSREMSDPVVGEAGELLRQRMSRALHGGKYAARGISELDCTGTETERERERERERGVSSLELRYLQTGLQE